MCSAVRRRMLVWGIAVSRSPARATGWGGGGRRRAGAGAAGGGPGRERPAGPGPPGRRGLAAALVEHRQHVVAGDAPAGPGARDGGRVEVVLGDEAPHDRRQQQAVASRPPSAPAAGAGAGASGRGRRGGRGLLCGRCRARRASGAGRGLLAAALGLGRLGLGLRLGGRLGRGGLAAIAGAVARRGVAHAGEHDADVDRVALGAPGSRTARRSPATAPRSRPCRSTPRTAARPRRPGRRPA